MLPEADQLKLLTAKKTELEFVVDQIGRIRVWFGENDPKMGFHVGDIDSSLEDSINKIEDAIWELESEIDDLKEIVDL
jgi:hypothetical protein